MARKVRDTNLETRTARLKHAGRELGVRYIT